MRPWDLAIRHPPTSWARRRFSRHVGICYELISRAFVAKIGRAPQAITSKARVCVSLTSLSLLGSGTSVTNRPLRWSILKDWDICFFTPNAVLWEVFSSSLLLCANKWPVRAGRRRISRIELPAWACFFRIRLQQQLLRLLHVVLLITILRVVANRRPKTLLNS